MNMNETSETLDETPQQGTESLRTLVENKNIAETLSDDRLNEIGNHCKTGFEFDLASREEWVNSIKDWTKLALQVKEEKSWPWPNASNVKYPLLATAAMQFNARAYPSLVPSSGDVVKVDTIGADPTGEKLERAKRVGMFMSYQLLKEMSCWEEDMDKLLIMLPIVGVVFKKTYYNPTTKKNVSELVLPENLVVNYWAKSLETTERASEIIPLSKRLVKEKMMSGIYREVDLGDPVPDQEKINQAMSQDETTPYQIIEQHTYLDMDDDGYTEPYVVTFERTSGKVLRIVARFDDETIYTDNNGNLQRIEAIQYYTKFGFIPNPDGSFYDIGFGHLLGPLNESVNTLVNQLIDAGTINNLQGGFLGKGLKLKMGESRWSPGEWKPVNTTADDLRKQIVPLPTKEPSNVLFQLMGSLITSGKELASVAEIFVGKMPGQNTPATTTMATIEQGMKVFTAVYKRVYRALTSEFKKIYDLNRFYLDNGKYASIVDMQIGPDDFEKDKYDICPSADPSTPTGTEKLMKAQALLELLSTGILDPVEVVRRVLEAQEQPNFERLFNKQIQATGEIQPQPDPKILELQMKGQFEQQKLQMQSESQAKKAYIEQQSAQAQLAMKAQEHQMDMQHRQLELAAHAEELRHKNNSRMAEGQIKQVQAVQDLANRQDSHNQAMQHAKEKARLVQTTKSSKTGKVTK